MATSTCGAPIATGWADTVAPSAAPNECAQALELLSRQVRDISAQVEHAVGDISGNFGTMIERVERGVARASILLRESADGGPGGVDALVSTTRTTLETLLEHIIRSSYLSMRAYQRMDKLQRAMTRIESVLERVDALALDTRILAVNAAISAAGAGAEGQRFGVFSREIRELSRSTAQMSLEIREVIKDVRGDFDSMSEELRGLASTDMNTTILAKDEIDGVLTAMADANEQMRVMVEEAQAESQDTTRQIGAAVMALQFQDAVSQRMAHVAESLTDVAAQLRAAEGLPPELSSAGLLDRMRGRYTMQAELEAVGLAPAGLAPPPEADDGDIELF